MADDTTPQEPAAPAQQQTQQPETGEVDWKDRAEAQQKVNRDLERKLKTAQADAEKAREASMSEAEKAIAEAEKRGAQQAAERYAARLVDESFRAASVGRTLQPDALLSFDRKQFLTGDGDVDRNALAAWVEANSSPVGPQRPGGDADQGPRSTPPRVGDPMRDFTRNLFDRAKAE